MPAPLAVVIVATRLHVPSMIVAGLAVIMAATTAAVVARWCAERRMRSDVETHERELAHTKRQILALVSH
jgi:Flp pilus assembly protein TadB